MRHHLSTVLATVAALGVLGGCATKGYVRETVDDRVTTVEGRISEVERQLDGTTAATERNASRIGEVDQTANTALGTATTATGSAQIAQNKADIALTVAEHVAAVQQQLLFEVVITEDVDQFGFGDATLPDTAMDTLDTLVQQLRDAPAAVQLEIQGHTDDTGPAEFNERLGLERAEAVKRYLYQTHDIPLHKMNVISFGEAAPLVRNVDRESRAKNRRVVVRVLGGGAAPRASRGTGEQTQLVSVDQ